MHCAPLSVLYFFVRLAEQCPPQTQEQCHDVIIAVMSLGNGACFALLWTHGKTTDSVVVSDCNDGGA